MILQPSQETATLYAPFCNRLKNLQHTLHDFDPHTKIHRKMWHHNQTIKVKLNTPLAPNLTQMPSRKKMKMKKAFITFEQVIFSTFGQQ